MCKIGCSEHKRVFISWYETFSAAIEVKEPILGMKDAEMLGKSTRGIEHDYRKGESGNCNHLMRH